MTFIETADGLALEADWTLPPEPRKGVVVLCHPHPRQGGTMQAPLMRALARHLGRAGFAVLRFNFRGIGASQGVSVGGDAEIEDVAAAVVAARDAHPEVEPGVAGWSFGAVTALKWQAKVGSTLRYVGIAPAIGYQGSTVVPDPDSLLPADRLLVIGDRDQYAGVADVEEYGAAIGAKVEVIEGSDHFFTFRDVRVAELLAGHFAPAA